MKMGKYRVSFDVDFDSAGSQEEAEQAVREMVIEMLDNEEFPKVEFELLEEFDPEYHTEEEEEMQELNFEVAV